MHISELSTPHLYETPEVAMAREKVEVSTGESAKDHLLEQETHRVMGSGYRWPSSRSTRSTSGAS